MIVRLSRPKTFVVEDPPSSPGPANAGLAGQLVRFGSIGIVSTVGFAALFALLLEPLGAALADIVALTGCAVVNTAANRRLTFELRGRSSLVRHHLAGLAVMLLPLTLNLAVLWALDVLEQSSLGVLLSRSRSPTGSRRWRDSRCCGDGCSGPERRTRPRERSGPNPRSELHADRGGLARTESLLGRSGRRSDGRLSRSLRPRCRRRRMHHDAGPVGTRRSPSPTASAHRVPDELGNLSAELSGVVAE